MGNKLAKIVKLEAKKYNKTRKLLKPAGITLTLQVKDGEDDTFTSLSPVIEEDWTYDLESYHERVKIRVARYLDTTFEANLQKATDVLIGSKRYEISQRDITLPDADNPFWKFYGLMNPETY